MVHIKRDGGWICGLDGKKWYYRDHNHISFTEAHKLADMKHICKDCVKEYYRRLDRMPVVVVEYNKPSKNKKAVTRTIEISEALAKIIHKEP